MKWSQFEPASDGRSRNVEEHAPDFLGRDCVSHIYDFFGGRGGFGPPGRVRRLLVPLFFLTFPPPPLLLPPPTRFKTASVPTEDSRS